MTETLERRYALTKVEPGDYLLPSNDGTTLWRIREYTDGPSFGLDPEVFPRDFQRWGLWKWHRPIDPHNDPGGYLDLEDWDRWIPVEDGFETRRDAIQGALRHA